MNIDNWGGAQWLLVAWAIAVLLVQILFFVAVKTKIVTAQSFPSTEDWISKRLGEVIANGILFAVLWWGGFWA